MTNKEKPTPALDDKSKGKEQNISTEKQPTLSGDNPKTEADAKHEQDFDAIYKTLHAKFPTIINMDKPVLLAVGIRREMLKHLEDDKDVTNLILNKWIKWYFRKSKYYSMHKVGTVRYNLDGTNAGIVTEKDQAKRDKTLEKIKSNSSSKSLKDKHISDESDEDKNESKDKE